MLSYWLYSLVFFSQGKSFKFKLVQFKKKHHKNTPPPEKKARNRRKKNPFKTPPPKKNTSRKNCSSYMYCYRHYTYKLFSVCRKKKKLNHTRARTEVLIHVMTIIIIRVKTRVNPASVAPNRTILPDQLSK